MPPVRLHLRRFMHRTGGVPVSHTEFRSRTVGQSQRVCCLCIADGRPFGFARKHGPPEWVARPGASRAVSPACPSPSARAVACTLKNFEKTLDKKKDEDYNDNG